MLSPSPVLMYDIFENVNKKQVENLNPSANFKYEL